MFTEENVSLRKYNTFGLDYLAAKIFHPENEREVKKVFENLSSINPYHILGGGSNLLFTADFKGTLIHPVIGGIKIERTDSLSATVSAGAGIKWDDLVDWTVRNNLSGLENLSLIPGNVGASPVQNIGAYGSEVSEIIEKVVAIRTADGATVSFSKEECGFDYRYSIFKGPEKNKYLVTRVYYKLYWTPVLNLEYGSVKEEVKKLGKETPENVRKAVINIRRVKLPDPDITGNAGSFFKNPVVPDPVAERLKKEFPHIPVYPEKRGYTKIAAGWLIEQCGWKGRRFGNAGVHNHQALVIVNYGNSTGIEIYKLSELIATSVKERFGIDLEREVEILGSI